MSSKETFEDNLKRLEDLVRKLEQNELGLEGSLKAFEEGTKLADVLAKELEKAQARVAKLTRDRQGEFALEEFEGDAGDDDE